MKLHLSRFTRFFRGNIPIIVQHFCRENVQLRHFCRENAQLRHFCREKFMITRSSIANEDFLGSSIASQVMPPWYISILLLQYRNIPRKIYIFHRKKSWTVPLWKRSFPQLPSLTKSQGFLNLSYECVQYWSESARWREAGLENWFQCLHSYRSLMLQCTH